MRNWRWRGPCEWSGHRCAGLKGTRRHCGRRTQAACVRTDSAYSVILFSVMMRRHSVKSSRMILSNSAGVVGAG